MTKPIAQRVSAPPGLRHSGLPLGGLGTGSVEFRTDGLFYQWQIANNQPWGKGPPFPHLPDAGFFSLHVSDGLSSWTGPLVVRPGYHMFLNDPYHFPWMDYPQEIHAEARFPMTVLKFAVLKFAALEVRLEAMSSFVPHNAEDSGLPCAIFVFSLSNPAPRRLSFVLVEAQSNLCGYTHHQDFSSIEAVETGLIEFSRDNARLQGCDDGTLALATWSDTEHQPSWLFHPRWGRDFWDALRESGKLDNTDFGDHAGPQGNIGQWQDETYLRSGMPYGFLANTVELEPGQCARVIFLLAWHFPNAMQGEYRERNISASRHGHYYSRRFSRAIEVAQYVRENFRHLEFTTRRFANTLGETSLESWKIDALSAQLSTLIKSSWWDEEGRFGIWEGLGCCGLHTIDVAHYACHPIVLLFPELQHRQMDLTLQNMPAPGRVPHLMPHTFECCNVDHRDRIDTAYHVINILWRDIIWTGDTDRAHKIWPSVESILALASQLDTDGDGLPNHKGPDQTYDQFPLKGTSSLVGLQAVAALFSAAEWAEHVGKTARSSALREQAGAALDACVRQLWTGSYFRLSHDAASGENNDGILADQLNGDWTRRMMCRAGIVDEEKVRNAQKTILECCVVREHGILKNCAWPDGTTLRIGRHTSNQPDLPWSGVEYALASHLLLLGLNTSAWDLVRMVWERYEAAGMRFNHIECGEHYYRAMSAWSVYLAWSGFFWDGLRDELIITATPLEGGKKAFAATTSAWGLLQVSRTDHGISARWELFDGKAQIHSVRSNASGMRVSDCYLNGARLDGLSPDERFVLAQVAQLRRGDRLDVNLTSIG